MSMGGESPVDLHYGAHPEEIEGRDSQLTTPFVEARPSSRL